MNRHKAYWSAMDSSRSPKEIFESIEQKVNEKECVLNKLETCINEIYDQRQFLSIEGTHDIIKGFLIDKLLKENNL